MSSNFHQISGATEMSSYSVIYELKQTQKAYKKASQSMVISFCEALLSAYLAQEFSTTQWFKYKIIQVLDAVGISSNTANNKYLYLAAVPVMFILLFIFMRLINRFISWIVNEFFPKATKRKRKDLIELVNKRLLNVVLLASDLEKKSVDPSTTPDTKQLYAMQAFACLGEAEKMISSFKLVEIFNKHMRGNIKYIKELNPLFLTAIIDTAAKTLERLKASSILPSEITSLKMLFTGYNQKLSEYTKINSVTKGKEEKEKGKGGKAIKDQSG